MTIILYKKYFMRKAIPRVLRVLETTRFKIRTVLLAGFLLAVIFSVSRNILFVNASNTIYSPSAPRFTTTVTAQQPTTQPVNLFGFNSIQVATLALLVAIVILLAIVVFYLWKKAKSNLPKLIWQSRAVNPFLGTGCSYCFSNTFFTSLGRLRNQLLYRASCLF